MAKLVTAIVSALISILLGKHHDDLRRLALIALALTLAILAVLYVSGCQFTATVDRHIFTTRLDVLTTIGPTSAPAH